MADTLFKLNTGASIPALGLGARNLYTIPYSGVLLTFEFLAGTWQSAKGEVKKAVSHALGSGYKHIDCAYVYGNEDEVGEGLRESFESGKVKREDIFVTTKLWCIYVSSPRADIHRGLNDSPSGVPTTQGSRRIST